MEAGWNREQKGDPAVAGKVDEVLWMGRAGERRTQEEGEGSGFRCSAHLSGLQCSGWTRRVLGL